jgi:hypothetical protein
MPLPWRTRRVSGSFCSSENCSVEVYLGSKRTSIAASVWIFQAKDLSPT